MRGRVIRRVAQFSGSVFWWTLLRRVADRDVREIRMSGGFDDPTKRRKFSVHVRGRVGKDEHGIGFLVRGAGQTTTGFETWSSRRSSWGRSKRWTCIIHLMPNFQSRWPSS